MGLIHVPTTSPEDWQRLLAEPDLHWKKGKSARTLAYCWEAADGFPGSVSDALRSGGDAFPQDLVMLAGLPERRVALPGGRRASQTDLFVLAGSSDGLVSICVEGKVDESFGPRVSAWLTEDASAGKHERLAFLARTCNIPETDLAPLRYQLLHRTASALLEAERFGARHAVLLVHSFSAKDAGFDDYQSFASASGATKGAAIGEIASLPPRSDVQLHLAWVRGEAEYLSA